MSKDAMPEKNAHVAAFAKRGRLRTRVKEDGEIVLHTGPLKEAGEAWYDGHGIWVIYAMIRSPSRLARRLREAGATVKELSIEVEARVPEGDLLRVLGCSKWTRPKRLPELSEEQREAKRRHMETVNGNKPQARRGHSTGSGSEKPVERLGGPVSRPVTPERLQTPGTPNSPGSRASERLLGPHRAIRGRQRLASPFGEADRGQSCFRRVPGRLACYTNNAREPGVRPRGRGVGQILRGQARVNINR
jgi:hypothetical protein